MGLGVGVGMILGEILACAIPPFTFHFRGLSWLLLTATSTSWSTN